MRNFVITGLKPRCKRYNYPIAHKNMEFVALPKHLGRQGCFGF